MVPRLLLSWRSRCMQPAEKRSQRSRFGCSGRAPSERRRFGPSRGVIIGGPVHDSATGGLVVPRLLLSWRPPFMEPAEKRPLRSRFGCRNLAPSDRRRGCALRGARIGGPVPGRATVASGISRKGLQRVQVAAASSPGVRGENELSQLKQQSASISSEEWWER